MISFRYLVQIDSQKCTYYHYYLKDNSLYFGQNKITKYSNETNMKKKKVRKNWESLLLLRDLKSQYNSWLRIQENNNNK